jgi:hypothetical protein
MQRIPKFSLVVVLGFLLAAGATAQESSQRLKEDVLKKGEEVVRNTDPKDVEAFSSKSFEARIFVVYLGCLKALPLPAPDEVESVNVAKWPLSFDLTVKYPLVLAVQINPKDSLKGRSVIVVKKRNSDSLWEMTEGRVESPKGKIIRSISRPSTQTQRKANAELARLLQVWKQRPTGCASDECACMKG